MPTTKKLAIAFNPAKPERRRTDFLVPALADGKIAFVGLKSKRVRTLGMIVFIGQAIDESDLSERAVEMGILAARSETSLLNFAQYIDALQTVKIGNIVRLRPDGDQGVALQVVAVSPSAYAAEHGAD